jgi:hypothetical protein
MPGVRGSHGGLAQPPLELAQRMGGRRRIYSTAQRLHGPRDRTHGLRAGT